MNESVFQHSGFRSFLLAHAQAKRSRARGWSYRRWAQDLGLENAATLTRIIKGDRSPGPEVTEKFVHYFAFTPTQAEFFRHLVRLEKTREADVRILILERLRRLHPKRKFQELDHRVFLAISNWYFAAIRESVRLKGASSDAAKISKALRSKVSPAEVKRAIEILIDLDLLARDPATGTLSYAGGIIDTKPDVGSEGAKRYIEQFLDQAKAALRETAIDSHCFTGTAMSIKREKIAEAKRLIHEFKARFLDVVTSEPGDGDVVFQFQTQFFPIVEGEEK
jgi:uncharacterized protein (TIGR02147 family)